jgi:hypothetical protein
MTVKATSKGNIASLIDGFPHYLDVFQREPPFNRAGQLEYHRETIQRRRHIGSAVKALSDDEFLGCLYKTLQAWGIGVRASKLRPIKDFTTALRSKTAEITALEHLAVDDPGLDVTVRTRQLWYLLHNLDIVTNDARIVAGSKALHHILPDLVVPIDRAYTQKFYCWQNPTFQYEQKKCFEHAMAGFAEIARRTNPAQYLGNGWHSSRSKVIDNAIVGFIMSQKASTSPSHVKVERKAPTVVSHRPRSTPERQVVMAKQPRASMVENIGRWLGRMFARTRRGANNQQ